MPKPVRKPDRFLARRWDTIRKADEETRKTGGCSVDILKTGLTRRIRVVAAFNPVFVRLAGEIGGKYNKNTRSWTFRLRQLDMVLRICRETFPDMLTVTDVVAKEASQIAWRNLYGS